MLSLFIILQKDPHQILHVELALLGTTNPAGDRLEDSLLEEMRARQQRALTTNQRPARIDGKTHEQMMVSSHQCLV